MFDLIIFPLKFIYLAIYLALVQLLNSYVYSLFVLSILTVIIVSICKKTTQKIEKSEDRIRKILDPQIKEIKCKYVKKERQDAIQRLYTRYGYNPIYGIRSAASVFLQLPFLLGAYFMLSENILLQGQSFGWISDLSKPDALLFECINILPLIMFVVSILNVFLATDKWNSSRKQGLGLSLFFLILLYTAPAALLIYWTGNNILYLFQTLYSKFKKIFNIDLKFKLSNFGKYALIGISYYLLFIYVGTASFIRNPFEFNADFFEFLKFLSWNILFVTLIGVSFLYVFSKLSKHIDKLISSLVTVILIFIFIQYNFLNDAQQLNGTEFDAPFTIKAYISAIFSILMLICSIIYAKKIRNNSYLLSSIVILLATFIFSYQYHNQVNELLIKEPNSNISVWRVNEAFNFSKNKNVIVIITDTFSGEIAKEIFKDPKYKMKYEGFTLFDDYNANFPVTMVSVAALLSGQIYDNTVPVDSFYWNTRLNTLPKYFKDQGYTSYLGAKNILFSYFSPELFDNIVQDQYKEPKARIYVSDVKLIKNTFVFSLAPNVLRNFFYSFPKSFDNNTWDFAFVNKVNSYFEATRDKPSFHYFHLIGAHPPYIINEDLSISNDADYLSQSKASLNSIYILIEKIKKAGIFDNSLIYITGDHPRGDYKEKSILGLLHVPNQHDFNISSHPLELKDFFEIIKNDGDYKNINKTRHFYAYLPGEQSKDSYLPVIKEYEILGKANDFSNYHYTGNSFYPQIYHVNEFKDYELTQIYDVSPTSFSKTIKREDDVLIATSDFNFFKFESDFEEPVRFEIKYLKGSEEHSKIIDSYKKGDFIDFRFDKNDYIKTLKIHKFFYISSKDQIVNFLDTYTEHKAAFGDGFEKVNQQIIANSDDKILNKFSFINNIDDFTQFEIKYEDNNGEERILSTISNIKGKLVEFYFEKGSKLKSLNILLQKMFEINIPYSKESDSIIDFLSGFSEGGKDYFWIIDNQADMRLKLKPDNYKLRFFIKPQICIKQEPLKKKVDILVNGTIKNSFTLMDQPKNVELLISKADIKNDIVDVSFKLDWVGMSPVTCGTGRDIRTLSLFMSNFCLSNIEKNSFTKQEELNVSIDKLPLKLDLNSSSYYFSGLSGVIEEFGRWTDGNEVSLFFNLSTLSGIEELKIKFNLVSVFLSPENSKIELDAFINDQTFYSRAFTYKNRDNKDLSMIIPKKNLKEGKNTLLLKLNGVNSPANLGLNNDHRLLGLAINSIEFSK